MRLDYTKRRHLLKSIGVCAAIGATSGCLSTSSDGKSGITPEQITVSGVENSNVYTDYEISGSEVLGFIFTASDVTLTLQYPLENEYDSDEHGVYLLDGNNATISKGHPRIGNWSDDILEMKFGLSKSDFDRPRPFRVVSKGPVDAVDDFEITIELTNHEGRNNSSTAGAEP
jgi:hypothetical protein